MIRETWIVMEDGSVADPSLIALDDKGVWRHKDGRPAAMRGDVLRSRQVNIEPKAVKPAASGPGYTTRVMTALDQKPDDASGDLASLRSQYQTKFGKKPFAGWDAAQLKEKIEAEGE